MAPARQISVRLAVEGAEQARAQLEAIRDASKAAGEQGAPSTAQLAAWDRLNRSIDSSYAATARYATVVQRVQQAEASGIGTAEQRNRLLEQAALAHQRVATATATHASVVSQSVGGIRNLGTVVGQAGFQLQDFAVQVAGGQSALVALGQQGSQMLGVFGTGGAIAGAVLAVGVLAVQFFGGADAAKALADAITAQEEIYRSATEASETYRRGLEQEAETVLRLRGLYASYSAARRGAEEARLTDSQAALEQQATALQNRVSSALPSVPQNLIDLAAARSARGQGLGPGVTELPVQLREGIAALMEFRASASASSETLSVLAVRLQEAAASASGPMASGFLQSAQAVRAMLPEAERLERSMGDNARQLAAIRDAAGGATTSLTGAAGAAGLLADRLQRLRQFAAANPALAVQQEAVLLQQRLDALRRGGLAEDEAELRRQENSRRVTEASNRAYEEQLRRLTELGRTRQEAEAGATTAAAVVAQETLRRNELGDAVDRERRRLEEAARAARGLAQAYGAISTNASGLLSLGAADNAAITEIQRATRGSTLDPQTVQRQAEQAARAIERELTENARRLDRAVERFGDTLADATYDSLEAGLRRSENVFASFASAFGSLLRRAAVEALSLTVTQPLVRDLAGAIGFTGASSGAGSITSALGLSSLLPAGGIAGALNAWGVSSGLSGNGVSFAANSGAASYGGFGLAGEGAVSGLLGSSTLTSALGGIGGGFAIGSTLGGYIAGDSPARQTNAQIGAGAGSLAGFAIGTAFGGPIVGALVGGAMGGAGGGLLGPGKGFSGGDALIGFDQDGLLAVTGYAGKNFDQQAELLAQARQQVAAYNAQLTAAGLSFSGRTEAGYFATALGGGESDNPRDVGGALGASGFRAGSLTSSNDNVRRALEATKSAPLDEALGVAQWVRQVYDSLATVKAPTTPWAEQIEALNKTFGEAIAKAREYGLATEALAANQAKAIAEIDRARAIDEAQRANATLADLNRQSRILGDFLADRLTSTGSAQSQFAAAQGQFDAALATARSAGPGQADVSRVVSAANTLLTANADFYAAGPQAAAIETMVRSSLASLGAALDLPGFTDDLTGAIERAASRQVDVLQQLLAANQAMREESRALRLVIERALAA
jgi:hypothetical protein